jgi:HSP20 family protein
MTTIKKQTNEFPVFGDVLADFFKEDIFRPSQAIVGKKIPAANILETSNKFSVQLAVPGFNKDNFILEVIENTLHISSKNDNYEAKQSEDTKYTLKEFNYTNFKRSFTLPENANKNAINANYFDGILEVNIEKIIPQKEIPIQIKVS